MLRTIRVNKEIVPDLLMRPLNAQLENAMASSDFN
jgi:hypothetical protein